MAFQHVQDVCIAVAKPEPQNQTRAKRTVVYRARNVRLISGKWASKKVAGTLPLKASRAAMNPAQTRCKFSLDSASKREPLNQATTSFAPHGLRFFGCTPS